MQENNEIIEKDTEETLFETQKIETNITDKEIIVKEKKTRKPVDKKKLIIIGAIIIGILVITLIVYFCFFRKDKNENLTSPEKEKVVISFDNYTYDNGILTFISAEKDTIGSYECIDKNKAKCYVAKFSSDNLDKPLYVDENGKQLFSSSPIYNGKYVFIYDDGKITLYDISKEEKLMELKEIYKGNTDLVAYQDMDSKYGILSIKENVETILKDLEYIEISDNENIFVTSKKGSEYLINKDGKALSLKINGVVKDYNDKYIVAYKDDSYNLYDFSGKNVLNKNYDYITIKDNYIFTILDTHLNVLDSDLAPYMEDDIKLKDNNYNPTYIFDKDNNLKETKKAFDTLFNEDRNTLTITTSDDKTKEINLYEGLLNKNYDYVSYFDGKLYIYEDKAKTKLLGKYNCEYENELSKDVSEFNNCFVAKEANIINQNENGFAPIINNRYIFINDTKTGANKKIIYLYDISEENTKSKYTMIDTGEADGNITNVNLSNKVIYARSYSDDGYGAITINSAGVESLIGFRASEGSKNYVTKSISRFTENYILAQRENKNYLYDMKGNQVASSIYEIIDYQNHYLLVKNNGYLLYKMASDGENGTIVSDELDQIKISNNYFIGIKNSVLNIYLLSDGKTPILEEGLLLEDINISDCDISVTSSEFVISVKESDKTLKYTYDLTGKKIS